ncbi:hypothetical protein AMTRI_Chr06g170420 [Amborella trichopoda]
MGYWALIVLLVSLFATSNANSEGDALHTLRSNLVDPNNVLQSWDPTLVNPCPWLHVTCNNENSVTRVDLGSAGLSGALVPELGVLASLQYLTLNNNNITGSIPAEFGKLKSLVSLDLQQNRLSGPIPQSLANLTSLKYLRLNNNKLSGVIPKAIVDLAIVGKLRLLNVTNNLLAGTNKNYPKRATMILQDGNAPF